MCRNIRPLYNFEPPATTEEVQAAALQYVRKVAGSTRPSQANAEAFDRAVAESPRPPSGCSTPWSPPHLPGTARSRRPRPGRVRRRATALSRQRGQRQRRADEDVPGDLAVDLGGLPRGADQHARRARRPPRPRSPAARRPGAARSSAISSFWTSSLIRPIRTRCPSVPAATESSGTTPVHEPLARRRAELGEPRDRVAVGRLGGVVEQLEQPPLHRLGHHVLPPAGLRVHELPLAAR